MIYANEIEPFCVQWLRNQGLTVDERSIDDIKEPDGSIRQHYFAGLGGWEHALRLAGWPEDQEVWTGSCPCQPLSVAGKRKGAADDRHLWPAFLRLIAIGRPPVIFGEQVASSDGRVWLAGVRTDLEDLGYAVGAADLCSASIGAPHIRQRLYWVAVAQHAQWRPLSLPRDDGRDGQDSGRQETHGESGARSQVRGLEQPTLDGRGEGRPQPERRSLEPRRDPSGLGDTRRQRRDRIQPERFPERSETTPAWGASEAILCSDGKWRRIPLEPSFQPLADDGRFGNPRTDPNLSSRLGALKASGNAICVPLAAAFVQAVMEVL